MNNGKIAEKIAAYYLQKLGYRILVRNYRAAGGEIDLIARDGDEVVFVEIKSHPDGTPPPTWRVDKAKKQRIARAATYYCYHYHHTEVPTRLEVVTVALPSQTVRHYGQVFFNA